ncbi:hypothetical protein K0817_002720 [Microbacterium sp. HD4P20]|uniref:hypothetical protein n=1 Tax=Microbacterium sp. HD4P20 TaxID=2864874 RepID=UPI0020A35682|nr:hypothetical protein [Microbacterium sp. HD4P20]MCP2635477.1 hypothetical protein [Microbacterium sp. HD4P20]
MNPLQPLVVAAQGRWVRPHAPPAASRRRADLRADRRLARRAATAEWMPSADDRADVGPDFFAADGFHPSAVGYHRWTDLVRERVVASPLPHERPSVPGTAPPVTAGESTP